MTLRARRRTALPAALVALVVGLTGCSQATSGLEEHNSVQQGNARPAASPPAARPAEGEVVDVGGAVRAVFADGDRVVAQLADPARLVIGGVTGTRWSEDRSVDLPADAGLASAGPDGTVLVPYGDGVVVVPRSGAERRVPGLGPVTAAAVLADGRLLTGHEGGEIAVRDADGAERHRIRGLTAVDQLAVAADGSVTALSRPDTVIASVDLGGDVAGPLLRAGKGAGMLGSFAGDSVVAADTVGDALLVYSTSPVRLHQMFPVADAPWAVAEDRTREVVWLTSTGTNTLQAYDLGDGFGSRRAEVPTVRQPDSLAVTGSGTLVVGSADGAGLHLLRPTLDEPAG